MDSGGWARLPRKPDGAAPGRQADKRTDGQTVAMRPAGRWQQAHVLTGPDRAKPSEQNDTLSWRLDSCANAPGVAWRGVARRSPAERGRQLQRAKRGHATRAAAARTPHPPLSPPLPSAPYRDNRQSTPTGQGTGQG